MISKALIKFIYGFLSFWLITYTLNILFRRQFKKYNIEVYPFLLIWKTKKPLNLIDKMCRRKRLWEYAGWISVGLGCGGLIFGLFYLTLNLVRLASGSRGAARLYPIIPGLTLSLDMLVYFILAVTLGVIVHELFHGIYLRLRNIEIKSVGIAVILFFFAAFVEPDEEQLKKARIRDKLKIFSSGTFANLLLGALFLLLLFAMFNLKPNGVIISKTIPGYPAYNLIEPYSVITEMNNTVIKTRIDFFNYMSHVKPGDIVFIKLITPHNRIKIVKLRLAASPYNSSRGFMGVMIPPVDYYPMRIPIPNIRFSTYLFQFFIWSIMVNLSLFLLNLLPIIPLDGGQMLASILELVRSEKLKKGVLWLLTCYSIMILVGNIVLSFMM